MRKKQIRELRRAILETYLSDKEREKLWNEAKTERGDTRKNFKHKIWAKGSKRDYLYKNGKKIFKNTPKSQKDEIRVGG